MNSDGKSCDRSQFTFRNCATRTDEQSKKAAKQVAARGCGKIPDLAVVGASRMVATLFTDIAGFTPLVETLEPDVLGPLLNDYLRGMTDVVFAHDGTVAKIVGDAIHMLLACPPSSPTRRRLRWRVHWRWIHARNCFAIDGGRKRSRSALPASAYMQARSSLAISAVAVFYLHRTRRCVSAIITEKVQEFRGRWVGDLVLRGKTEALRAFDPLSDEQYESDTTSSYVKAFAKLEATMRPQWRHLRRMSAKTPMISSPDSTSSGF
jgi:adenylate cyclase